MPVSLAAGRASLRSTLDLFGRSSMDRLIRAVRVERPATIIRSAGTPTLVMRTAITRVVRLVLLPPMLARRPVHFPTALTLIRSRLRVARLPLVRRTRALRTGIASRPIRHSSKSSSSRAMGLRRGSRPTGSPSSTGLLRLDGPHTPVVSTDSGRALPLREMVAGRVVAEPLIRTLQPPIATLPVEHIPIA